MFGVPISFLLYADPFSFEAFSGAKAQVRAGFKGGPPGIQPKAPQVGIFVVSNLSPGEPFDWNAFTSRIERFPGQLMVIFISYGEGRLTSRWRWYAPTFEGEFVIRVAFINKALTPPHFFRVAPNVGPTTL